MWDVERGAEGDGIRNTQDAARATSSPPDQVYFQSSQHERLRATNAENRGRRPMKSRRLG